MLKVLIVEDNPCFRQCLHDWLQSGFPDMRIVDARDGAALMETLADVSPHLVFMDVKLPGANGLSLTGQIKSVRPEVSVAVMTSHDQPEYREAAHAAGADYFFRKDELDASRISALMDFLAATRKSQGCV